MALDLVIRGGTVVDGSGKPRFGADLGIKDGRIVDVGRITAAASRTIDADGLIVSPGFIDGHTHMDAQVAWDPLGTCSCWHGVTSVVMSNCGFALAPCKPADRDWYARCLSAVEDIPTEAMAAGIDWTWETFPEYLATVERLPKAINYGMYIGHSALRMYVMGKRALSEKATEDDFKKSIRGIGPEIGGAVLAFFAEPRNRATIQRLREAGLAMTEEGHAAGPRPLDGKSIVLTGSLRRLTRDEARDLVLRLGGRVTGSVSKKTDYVVVGEDAGSKADDARRLKVPVLDEAQFLTLVGR